MANARKQVTYTGHVQGVGFRFTVCRVAQRHAVTGFVRNLPSGDVELVAEGQPEVISQFLHDVAEAMSGYIDNADVADATPTGEFQAFDVRY